MNWQSYMFNNPRPGNTTFSSPDADARLEALLTAYREACPTPDSSANFMPNLWARIETANVDRRRSANIFSQTARFLVTAALAVTVVFGIMLSIEKQGGNVTAGVYMEALVTDGEAALDLLNPENMAEMEQQ